MRPSTGEPPKRVCFIQCVGSRDRQIGNEWCSKVCCGVACKEAIEIRELVPDCQVFVFYIDMRMYGFWEDQIYWKAQEETTTCSSSAASSPRSPAAATRW